MARHTLFFFCLALGTTITLSSSTLFLMWIGLEISSFAILPLMASEDHPRAKEAATKYFIVQAAGAALFLFTALINATLTGSSQIYELADTKCVQGMLIALALKMGVAPLHTWLPDVLQGTNLTSCLILSTWQKLAPLTIVIQMAPHAPALSIILGLTSIWWGGLAGLNQTQIRKILAYSSIVHMGWIMLVVPFSSNTPIAAFLIYCTMVSTTFLILVNINALSLASLASSYKKAPLLVNMISPVLFSLSGLPPFSGFGAKLLMLEALVDRSMLAVAAIASISSVLALLFYLRVVVFSTIFYSPHMPQTLQLSKFSSPTPFALTLMVTLSLALLPLLPAISSVCPT